MTAAYQDVARIAQSHKTDMRTAAFILGIGRVAKATISRKHFVNPEYDQY